MIKNIFIFLITSFLFGCAAVGHVQTNNPYKKLVQACDLLYSEVRPGPAKRVIKEAINICKENNDTPCLAQAYLVFGSYYRALGVFPESRRKNKESIAKNKERIKLAKEFFQKAEGLKEGDIKFFEKINLARNTELNKLGVAAQKFCIKG